MQGDDGALDGRADRSGGPLDQSVGGEGEESEGGGQDAEGDTSGSIALDGADARNDGTHAVGSDAIGEIGAEVDGVEVLPDAEDAVEDVVFLRGIGGEVARGSAALDLDLVALQAQQHSPTDFLLIAGREPISGEVAGVARGRVVGYPILQVLIDAESRPTVCRGILVGIRAILGGALLTFGKIVRVDIPPVCLQRVT